MSAASPGTRGERSLASQRSDGKPVAGRNADGLTGGVACGTDDERTVIPSVLHSEAERLIWRHSAKAQVDEMTAVVDCVDAGFRDRVVRRSLHSRAIDAVAEQFDAGRQPANPRAASGDDPGDMGAMTEAVVAIVS